MVSGHLASKTFRHQEEDSPPRHSLLTKLDEISDDNPYCSEYLTCSQSSTQATQLVASLLAASRPLGGEMTVNRGQISVVVGQKRGMVELERCVSYNNNKLYLHD